MLNAGKLSFPGNPIYNQTVDEPYTLDPAVLHRVLDGIADAIEAVQGSCARPLL